ncbi:hypothetical protein NEIELOOT_00889 [Neisseria elongata subsp. glycolytica ATCC 29315]|uniref:Uncharacterized protein n=1 Tax=Neisseria elongata subsp. glycolytica ATCC 29315 TaxID=546263 RepID=D4DPA5_NEIEG|nr:hypothetical protein NEIELOOT_00889 [Neisseria elongata subsp. glycolytica ATCC 29315]
MLIHLNKPLFVYMVCGVFYRFVCRSVSVLVTGMLERIRPSENAGFGETGYSDGLKYD